MPSPYSPGYLHRGKATLSGRHSGWPRRAFAHCGGFATAAPRRAWALISVPISGLPLSRPVPVIGLVGRYPTNNLIGRGPILGRRRKHGSGALSVRNHSRHPHLSGISPSFPGLSPSQGQVSHVLRSRPPRLPRRLGGVRLACLSPTPIAVGSGRINRSCGDEYGLLCLAQPQGQLESRRRPKSAKPTSDLSMPLRSSF